MEQLQSLFAPIVATIAGAALLFLWRYNRNVKYLPYFASALFSFALAVIFSQNIFPKMTPANALSNSVFYFASSGFMVHAAMMRIGERLNLKLHLVLMILDVIGRFFILQMGYSSGVYLIYANAMLSTPLAIGAVRLIRHHPRDPQSTALASAYGFIVFLAICVTPVAVSLGDQLNTENFFFSFYWAFLSILTVVGIFVVIIAYAFTVATDLVRLAESNDQKINETFHDLRQPLHALRLKVHGMMQNDSEPNKDYDDVRHTFGYMEQLVSDRLGEANRAHILGADEIEASSEISADAILSSVHEMFLCDAETKGLALQYEPSDYQFNIEPLALMRIASNLVSNAIKYTKSGTVIFGLREVNGIIRLEVRDTGIGMTAEEFKAALSRKVRIKKGAALAEGNGYGLSIVKELADEHQLKLSLDSRSTNGTCVVVETSKSA